MFMQSATKTNGVRLVVACPNWSRESLLQLFAEFDVPEGSYELIGPAKPAVLWSIIDFVRKVRAKVARQKQQHPGRKRGFSTRVLKNIRSLASGAVRMIVRSRNPLVTLPIIVASAVAAPVLIALAVVLSIWRRVWPRLRAPFAAVSRKTRAKVATVRALLVNLARKLYKIAQDEENQLVVRAANRRDDIDAWYCPTAFWPQVNQLRKPVLICVPDVVPTVFPEGFARRGGEPMFASFKAIERTIREGKSFVTYSQEIKDGTLINRFNVPSEWVHVVRHGVSRLDHLTRVYGFPDNEKASKTMCVQYFSQATAKVTNNWLASRFGSGDLGYIFYASQFRPNKNVVTLLRAFKWLRRERLIPYKLVLTGSRRHEDKIAEFLDKYELHDDVLCMERLTEKELAGAYRCATLAVNPSLAEGGMPFTFGEAVSVGTPVIMADIAVTREVLQDKDLYELTTFDGHDWRSLANKIEWALKNREALLQAQRAYYDSNLVQRGWDEVAAEYLSIMGSLAERHRRSEQESRKRKRFALPIGPLKKV
jgi:glycosyltransferase involved in cell wall biosynthesis